MLVVDASVAIKWFVTECDRDKALSVIDLKAQLVVPDLFRAEFSNILWKKVLRSEIEMGQAERIIESVEGFVTGIPTSREIALRALDLAISLGHPVYDCIYVALAEHLGTKCVTADKHLLKKCEAAGITHLLAGLDNLPLAMPGLKLEDTVEIRKLSNDLIETFSHLRQALKPADAKIFIFRSTDMRPALESPAHKRIEHELGKLGADKIADLVALCWLGRGFDGNEFAKLRARAEQMLGDDPFVHSRYIISILPNLERGFAFVHGDLHESSKSPESNP